MSCAGDRVRRVGAGEHAGLDPVLVLALDVLARPRPGGGSRRRPGACSDVVRSATIGCSGASTMNVAPNSVSGRVVNTSIGPAGESNRTRAPALRPIQLRCIVFSESDQSRWSRSSISRSAYAVMRIIHWRIVRLNTGKLPRSLRPSAVTSSLATTVPEAGAPVDRRLGDVGQALPVDRRRRSSAPSARPAAPVGDRPAAGFVLGDQLGDRAGPPRPPSGRAASGSYQESKICTKIHCVQR